VAGPISASTSSRVGSAMPETLAKTQADSDFVHPHQALEGSNCDALPG